MRKPCDARNEFKRNPEIIPSAIDEFLRHDSPVEHTLTRIVAQAVQLAGQQLKQGDLVIVILGAPLARLEGEIALRASFERIPDLTLNIDVGELK